MKDQRIGGESVKGPDSLNTVEVELKSSSCAVDFFNRPALAGALMI
ncbi:hypothetical protein HED54_05675 [Ochrobactrum anthropi ATCC 49188]|nr:hypothetical protein [Brucella anthropi ATCC 49188]